MIVAGRGWPPFAYGLYGLMRTVYVPASRLPRATVIPSETERKECETKVSDKRDGKQPWAKEMREEEEPQ